MDQDFILSISVSLSPMNKDIYGSGNMLASMSTRIKVPNFEELAKLMKEFDDWRKSLESRFAENG